MFWSRKANVRVKSIDDLKRLYRKEGKKRILKYCCIFTFAVLFIFLYQDRLKGLIVTFLIYIAFYLFNTVTAIRAISSYPKVSELTGDNTGNFSPTEISDLVDDVRRKLNTKREFDVRIVPDKQSQALTTTARFKKFFKNKNILAIHEGLLRTLTEPELKAVVAHEIGHHLSPPNASSVLGEYWADFYACKYFNPVAMANALIKIDQNSFLLDAFIQRCIYLANSRMPPKYINEEFWEYVLENVSIPFKSKREANRLAKQIVTKYEKSRNLPKLKRNIFSKLQNSLSNKFTGDILNRKKLAEVRYVSWNSFDNRIKDSYLDKYELIKLFNVIKNKKMTINRSFFFDIDEATHPNTNRRLMFIIENFLLVKDYSYRRLFNKASEKKLKNITRRST